MSLKKKELLFSRQVMSDFFEPVDCSPPGSSVHGIIQARILEWVAISFFKEKKRERDEEMLGRSGVWSEFSGVETWVLMKDRGRVCSVQQHSGPGSQVGGWVQSENGAFTGGKWVTGFPCFCSTCWDPWWLGFFSCLSYCLLVQRPWKSLIYRESCPAIRKEDKTS